MKKLIKIKNILLGFKIFYIGILYSLITSGIFPPFQVVLYLMIMGLTYLLLDRENDSLSESFYSISKYLKEVILVFMFTPFLSGATMNPELLLLGIFILIVLDYSVKFIKRDAARKERVENYINKNFYPSRQRHYFY